MFSFFCRKETRTHIHINIHSASARMYTQSFPRSLALYPHKRAHKRNCQHLHSGKWYLIEQRQNTWMKSHLKCNMLLNCIKSYRSVKSWVLSKHRIAGLCTNSNSPLPSVCFLHNMLTARTCNKSTRWKYGPAIFTKYFPNSSLAYHNHHETICNLLLMNTTNPKHRVCRRPITSLIIWSL